MNEQLTAAGRNIYTRFGLAKTAGCAALGCLLPVSCMLIFSCSALWWIVPTGMFVSAQPVQERRIATPVTVQNSPGNGQRVQVAAATPVYPKTNEQGAVYQPGVPSMMFNQPAMSDHPMQEYSKYEGWAGWEDSLVSKSNYLARANLTGERRTPYTQGQALTYPDGTVMSVVTGDFDFTLLQDQHGDQWLCGPLVNTLNELSGCQFWR